MNRKGLFYKDDGKGHPVLFLHAFPLDLTMWDNTVDACVTAGYRAVRIDLPGFGNSRGPMVSIAAAAEEVAALVRALVLEKPFVCGLSMGGYVAFELLRIVPGLFSGAILCDTNAAADSPGKRADRLATIEMAGTDQFADFVDGFVETLLSPRAIAGNPELPFIIRTGFERAGPKAISAAQRAMANRRSSEDILPGIRIPVLLMFGEDDPMKDAGADIQNAVEGAEFRLVQNAGHFSNLENPADFNQAFLDFLNRVTIDE
ncbi:MAG: alpha/beta hydrolase [Acidobacteriota bacterium]|nr:alpha/beta hydrolase [Acidobacteriota bacterium]MDH3529168.1 alpha/beta hydrolase [Acidobacteriota bacterium]